MLLLHQIGSVKIGQVVRYTVTYTPSHDRILPPPDCLYLRIRNTSPIPLRAAFVHGPYNLSVAAYPAHFNPNEKFSHPRRYGVPEFEPMLKPGGTWNCRLLVPEHIRPAAGAGTTRHNPRPAVHIPTSPVSPLGRDDANDHQDESASWIIDLVSQVIFSTSAAVHYEVLLARDERALTLTSTPSQSMQPARLSEHQLGMADEIPDNRHHHHHHGKRPPGVFLGAVQLRVEDTAALWNKPPLPDCLAIPDEPKSPKTLPGRPTTLALSPQGQQLLAVSAVSKRLKKVHLIVLTHGIHGNLGADMLFLKESIDQAVRKAKAEARARRSASRGTDGDGDGGEEDDEADAVVRGYSGNATRTERGIKYLGKRLARYILSMAYPDKPFFASTKAAANALTRALKASQEAQAKKKRATDDDDAPAPPTLVRMRAYKITQLSLIGHSLGGLVQTYAIAYIQKHAPTFFDDIEPINFVAVASPLLGLSHENPFHVKFALDLGLVGRTGQDLGLTWRAPTIARSGWGAIVSNLGESAHKRAYGETQPESKPLLRILPTGPAHTALAKFRNRTVYSNVVNDGIVPLRTSCLLFLDWQGLGRVEKARREAGLIETVVGFGWAELTGTNQSAPRSTAELQDDDDGGEDDSSGSIVTPGGAHEVPQPPSNAIRQDNQCNLESAGAASSPPPSTYPQPPQPELQVTPARVDSQMSPAAPVSTSTTNNNNPFAPILNFFRREDGAKSPTNTTPERQKQIYRRSQTLRFDRSSSSHGPHHGPSPQSIVTMGDDNVASTDDDGPSAPPPTSFFESAGDMLNPKIPPVEWMIDPAKRPRTIFHDRVYHPFDIPPPPVKKRTEKEKEKEKEKPKLLTSAVGVEDGGDDDKTACARESEPPMPVSPLVVNPWTSQAHLHKSSLPRRRTDRPAKCDTQTSSPTASEPSVVEDIVDGSQMNVEEKIARAYHRGMSWRKVLVKVEPDAHNNIIVRRAFPNAYGWPVIKHLVDTHFGDSRTACTRNDCESGRENVRKRGEAPDRHGEEVKTHPRPKSVEHASGGVSGHGSLTVGSGGSSGSPDDYHEAAEATDTLACLPFTTTHHNHHHHPHPGGKSYFSSSPGVTRTRPRPPRRLSSLDSVTWSDGDWADSGDESDVDTSMSPGTTRRDSGGVREIDDGPYGVGDGKTTTKRAVSPIPAALGALFGVGGGGGDGNAGGSTGGGRSGADAAGDGRGVVGLTSSPTGLSSSPTSAAMGGLCGSTWAERIVGKGAVSRWGTPSPGAQAARLHLPPPPEGVGRRASSDGGAKDQSAARGQVPDLIGGVD